MYNNFDGSPILSIKPHYMDLILSGTKKYEFRNFKPNFYNGYFWVYESSPTKSLKYLFKISSIIIYPEKISGSSYGVDRFNSGEMKSRYAFEIEELYTLENPLSLNFLRNKFNFTAPQAYTYLFNNPLLQDFLKNEANLIRLI